MKKNIRNLFSVLLCFTITCCMSLTAEANSLNVESHSADDIRAYANSHKATVNDQVTYDKKPSIKLPYSAGQLSQSTLQSALNMLNQVRYIAGIDADVSLNDTYNKRIQTGVLVNSLNNVLSHYPEQPPKMSKDLFDLGYSGTSSSNLGIGYYSINYAMIYGWMHDGDSTNIDRIGHRRWVLNPSMKETGFGMVNGYSGVYAVDMQRESSYTNVAWPAQNMPVEYFSSGMPWSVSTGVKESKKDVSVVLARTKDNKQWRFSEKHSDGAFYVNNDYYGQVGAIIFSPKNIDLYKAGDTYQVQITGLVGGDLNYSVRFFDLKKAVKPKKPTIQSGSINKKRTLTVKWKKASNANGYVLRYSTKKNMSSSKSIVIKNTVTKKVIKNINPKKNYYVQIQSYQNTNGTKTYSAWSKIKNVKHK